MKSCLNHPHVLPCLSSLLGSFKSHLGLKAAAASATVDNDEAAEYGCRIDRSYLDF